MNNVTFHGDIIAKTINTSEQSFLFSMFRHHSHTKMGGNILFGEDEFPTEDSVGALLRVSRCYTVTEKQLPLGVIILTPSVFCINNVATYAEARILFHKNESFSDSFKTLINLAVYLAGNLGYEACIYETFYSNVILVRLLRNVDFAPIVTIPKSGFVNGKGWQDNVIFMKIIRNMAVRTLLFKVNL